MLLVPVMLLVADRKDCAEAKELAEAKDSGLMRSRGVAVPPAVVVPFCCAAALAGLLPSLLAFWPQKQPQRRMQAGLLEVDQRRTG